MRVLITGSNGFVGPHAAAALQRAGAQVLSYGGPGANPGVDVRDARAVAAMVKACEPDAVAHLAGWASVGESFRSPVECFGVNATGTLHVLEAIRRHAPRAKTLVVSSAEVYGSRPVGERVKESAPVAPLSPYAVSKVAAEQLACEYHRAYALEVVVARSFNHVGPGQSTRFAIASFAEQIRQIAQGKKAAVLRVGNLDPVRDFSSVFDVADAYALLLREGAPGEVYNVCRGRGWSIREAIEQLLQHARVQARIEVDPERVRPADIPWLVGNPEKLTALGWSPERSPFEGLLEAPPGSSSGH